MLVPPCAAAGAAMSKRDESEQPLHVRHSGMIKPAIVGRTIAIASRTANSMPSERDEAARRRFLAAAPEAERGEPAGQRHEQAKHADDRGRSTGSRLPQW